MEGQALYSQDIALMKGYDSPLGHISLAERNGKLIGAWFDGQKHDQAHIDESREAQHGEANILDEATSWLSLYFSGKDTGRLPSLAPVGSTFQHSVWHEIALIAYGQTLTYGQIAKRIEQQSGHRCSPRSVGVAVGRNPLLIFIPCHRVVGADGSLIGYAGGLQRKKALLEMEHTQVSSSHDTHRDSAI